MTGSLYEVDDFGESISIRWKNLILPAIVLGIRPLAVVIQLMRNSLLEVFNQDYIRTARAKGLSEFQIIKKHVIGHEIGHSIGFRHTDWFSRQSCGQNVNEGTAGVGAVHIPGTPTGYDSTSLMLACFSANEDGEFNNNDIIALNYLY